MTNIDAINLLESLKTEVIEERDKHITFPPSYIKYQDYADACDKAIEVLDSLVYSK